MVALKIARDFSIDETSSGLDPFSDGTA